MMKKLLLGFFVFLFAGLQAQDPFSGLSPRQRLLPNEFIPGAQDVKIRLTVDGRMNNFVLLQRNMFEFVYDSISPMGRVVPVSMSDSAAIFRVAKIYVQGKYGADKNYKMYTPPAVTTLVLSAIPFAGPVLGAAFAVPASLTPVKIQNLGHPNMPLVEHRLYYQGYSDEARRIKARRIWLNFGIGFGICLGTMFLNESMDGELFGFQIFKQEPR
jgi:hypothetical protein